MKKKIYKDDFYNIFKITYLEHNTIAASELLEWNIMQDREYSINPRLNATLTEQYGQKITDGYTAPMHIKWVNKTIEYGVFAEQDIKKNEMIAEYTGILCKDSAKNDNPYIWDYPSIILETIPDKKRRRKNKYCIDALTCGNYARFINHTHRRYQNVGIQMIAANNTWHVIYLALKTIYSGQQLLTYYGTDYWKDRNILPAPLKP